MEINLREQIIKIIDSYFKWFAMILAIIIFLIGYFFIILPEQLDLKNRANLNILESEYLEFRRELTKLSELGDAYIDIKSENIDKIESILPAKPDIEELMRQMEVIVLQNGLFLSSLQISEGSKDGNIGKVNITISVTGADYEAFKSLLYTIETNLRLLDIEQLNFSPGSKSTTFRLVAYYQ